MGKHVIVFRLNLVLLMGMGFGLGTILVTATDLGVAGAWIGMDTGLLLLSVGSLRRAWCDPRWGTLTC